jgi:hypothetical protein
MVNIMGGRGAAAQNNSGSGKGTGKGKDILSNLLSGKTVTVKNLENGIVFTIEHLGQDSHGKDQFKSTIKENPKNAHDPQSILTTLKTGTTSHSTRDLSKPSEKDAMIKWLDRLQKV